MTIKIPTLLPIKRIRLLQNMRMVLQQQEEGVDILEADLVNVLVDVED
jgi:ribosomal protein L4